MAKPCVFIIVMILCLFFSLHGGPVNHRARRFGLTNGWYKIAGGIAEGVVE